MLYWSYEATEITKMKKMLKFFDMMLCVMFMAVVFSACSNDDDDDKNPSIVGTWYVEKTYDVGTSYEYTSYAEITYGKNGMATGYWKDTYKNGETEIETDKGRYEVVNDVLRIWWEDDSDDGDDEDEGPWTTTFKISGNKMTTSENGGTVWTRK